MREGKFDEGGTSILLRWGGVGEKQWGSASADGHMEASWRGGGTQPVTGGRRDRSPAMVGTGSAADTRHGFKTGEGTLLTGRPGWHSAGRRHHIRFEIEFQTNSKPSKF
jgi:hypothetical protein